MDQDIILETILQTLHTPTYKGQVDGGEIRFLCPAHNDQRHPSATYNPEKKVWICRTCGEGGGWTDLAKRLGIPLKNGDNTKPPKTKPTRSKIVATYDYRAEDGTFLYQVVRKEPGKRGKKKDFLQRRPDPDQAGQWIWNLNGTRRVLYNLPQVVEAKREGRLIFITEGEKDADNLKKWGLVATTNAGGSATGANAKRWEPSFTETLAGAQLVILPDNDQAGQGHLATIGPALAKVCKGIRVLTMPGGHKDVSDWIAAGGTAEEFKRLVREAPLYQAPEETGAPLELEARNTDLGNALRLVARHGRDLRYSHAWGKWFTWTGRHWSLDGSGEIERRAKETVAAIHTEALELQDTNYQEGEELAKHAKRSESRKSLQDMIILARSEPGIPVAIQDLDQDPMTLNLLNGTLNLETLELRQHRRGDNLTRLLPLEYHEDADCPIWKAFLHQVLDGNEELIDFLQRFIGYSLTGDVSEQVLLFLYGTGANGKSTFLNTILQLMGPYAIQAAPDLLMTKSGDTHPTELADLHNRRLAICTEIEAGRHMAEVTVKQLTGGDRIRARRMREDFWEFEPTHKIILAANHKPVIRGTDHAIWRRIRMVPFTVTIPEADRDPRFPQYLRDELEGILTWAIEGARAWRETGLQTPDIVKAATSDYQDEMDLLGHFINECCIVNSSVSCTVKDMYEAYQQWCADSGHRSLGKSNFNVQLLEKGKGKFEKKPGSRNVFYWHGIGLLTNDSHAPHWSDQQ